jgi:hypothetical protein
VGIALKSIALGLGNALGVMAKGRSDFLLLSFFLEFFEFIEQEIELFRVHIQIS